MIRFSKLFGGKPRAEQAARSFFDEDHYLAENPDVAREKADPYTHYLAHGWKEGRNPSAVFSTLYYLDRYLAGRRKPINPLIHYAGLRPEKRHGVTIWPGDDFLRIQAETIASRFDPDFYRKTAQIEDERDLLTHYLTRGWRKGFEPTGSFSAALYLEQNPHVGRLGLNPFYHFVSTARVRERSGRSVRIRPPARPAAGQREAQRSAQEQLDLIRSAFDAAFYLDRNEDVRRAGTDPLRHFIDYGAAENRDPNEIFRTGYYRERHADEIGEGVNPFYHYLKIGRPLGDRPNPFGYGLWPRLEAPSEDEWRAVLPARAIEAAEIVLIMPVYKGYDDTLRAVHSVLANRQETVFALLVIDDCGPEERLSAALRDLAGRGLLTYLRNDENRGFVRSVNRGLAEAAGRDVVLLNADIVVYGNWLDRLLAHAKADPRVATITPFSNNATICSYPQINIDNRISLEVTPDRLDAFAAICNAGSASPVPTGVGFCFYMRRAVMDEIGLLDAETFGRGYGEENDFCMRAARRGYRNLLAHDVFVFHSGRVSFGSMSDEKSRKIFDTLLGKHPDYRLKIRNHVMVDPARTARARLDLYRFAQAIRRKPAILLTHKSGGGIETHIQELSRRLDESGFDVVLLRIAGSATLEIDLPEDSAIDFPSELLPRLCLSKEIGLLAELLGWISPELVHVHSFAKLDWDSTTALMSLFKENGTKYYYTLHDYAPVCHRNHLVTPEQTYCGLPDPAICRDCIRRDAEAPGYVDPAERRARYGAFLGSAARILAPSADVAERVSGPLPGLSIAVRPHEETLEGLAWRRERKAGTALKVAAIGAVGTHKGADVLYNLALDARMRELAITFTIIGYSHDVGLMRSVGIRETGRYETEADAMRLVNEVMADLVLLPSIWPETYCYTLSLALASGVPPVVFDLGAPAGRLRERDEGHILEAGLADDPQRLNDTLLALDLDALWARRRPFAGFRYERFARDYYGLEAVE